MSNEIFRKKSLEKIQSPESLDDYVRVSNPGVWLLLVAIIALLGGACLWGTLGRIETTVKARAVVSGGDVVCYLTAADATDVEQGDVVRIADSEGVVSLIEPCPSGSDVCATVDGIVIEDGTYPSEVVTESIKPLSFVFN